MAQIRVGIRERVSGDQVVPEVLNAMNTTKSSRSSVCNTRCAARGITDYGTLLTSLGTLKGGIDRINYTTNDLTTDHGVTVRRSRTYVWSTPNSDVSTLVSTSESTLDGLQSWQTQYRDASTPVTSHSQTVYGANGVRTVTTTAPDNSYTISVYTNGQSLSVTRYDSGGTQIGKATYGYDAHGRQNRVTDARNGTTTLAYNNADQVQTSTTPVPGTGQFRADHHHLVQQYAPGDQRHEPRQHQRHHGILPDW